jgi:hypothetical protein
MIDVRWSSLLVRILEQRAKDERFGVLPILNCIDLFGRSRDGPTGQQIGIHHDLSRRSQTMFTRLCRFKRLQVGRQRRSSTLSTHGLSKAERKSGLEIEATSLGLLIVPKQPSAKIALPNCA